VARSIPEDRPAPKRKKRTAAEVDRRTTRRAERVVKRAKKKVGRIDKRREKFGLDPIMGRPTTGDEPQAVTDPYSGAPTINVFMQGQDQGQQYPTGSMAPAPAQHETTDRTKVDLANQVGNL